MFNVKFPRVVYVQHGVICHKPIWNSQASSKDVSCVSETTSVLKWLSTLQKIILFTQLIFKWQVNYRSFLFIEVTHPLVLKINLFFNEIEHQDYHSLPFFFFSYFDWWFCPPLFLLLAVKSVLWIFSNSVST